jgi:hypothetical protein
MQELLQSERGAGGHRQRPRGVRSPADMDDITARAQLDISGPESEQFAGLYPGLDKEGDHRRLAGRSLPEDLIHERGQFAPGQQSLFRTWVGLALDLGGGVRVAEPSSLRPLEEGAQRRETGLTGAYRRCGSSPTLRWPPPPRHGGTRRTRHGGRRRRAGRRRISQCSRTASWTGGGSESRRGRTWVVPRKGMLPVRSDTLPPHHVTVQTGSVW